MGGVYTMELRDDQEQRQLREISSEQRLAFVKGLKVVDVIGVYCGGEGGVGHTFFWLAQVQRKSRVDAADGGSAVPFRAEKAGPGWDISRGEWILNIRWLQRVRVKVFKQAGEQVLALTSVLPLRVVWHKTTTNQYTLSDSQHEELLYLCRCVQELRPSYKLRV